MWWGGCRDRSASMPPYLPVPRWRDPAPASGAIARSVTTPTGAARSDRRRHRRGRRHGVDSVVAGRGVGRDMGDATNALLQWPETRSVQLVAPPRPASPAAAPRRAAASRRHVPCSALRRTYFGVRAVAPSDPETTQDHPRLPEIARDDPRSPEITRDYPRRLEITRDYLRFPSLPEITRDCPR